MNKKILIVLANYYKDISDGLLNSALKNIPKSSHVKIIRVPGVFEIWIINVDTVIFFIYNIMHCGTAISKTTTHMNVLMIPEFSTVGLAHDVV